jgi:hypothetical protein
VFCVGGIGASLCDKSGKPFDFRIDALSLQIYGRPMKHDEMSLEEQAARLPHRAIGRGWPFV